ncbi:MAG: hypothetical protein BKP49_00200 [Treponema sp. CETP13]|nr:MAG: hypothetical protein BKP49_00200 [Treponema sp. CETP13]
MTKLEKKTENEKKIVGLMISIYCKKNHKQSKNASEKKNNDLCPECLSLKEYVDNRIDKCPRKDVKTFCSQCPIHCYSEERRLEIKKVMRFSGPIMLFYHPVLTIRHAYHTLIGR